MTAPIEPVRLTAEELNQYQNQGTAGPAWAFAELGVTWPTDYWVLVPVNGVPELQPAVVLNQFAVAGTVDAAGRFALAAQFNSPFPVDRVGPTGTDGVTPYYRTFWALDADEAIALARADAETPAP